MRRLAPVLLSLLLLAAMICPALCLAQSHRDAHACCHSGQKSVAKASPCGTATFAQFTDRYPAAPDAVCAVPAFTSVNPISSARTIAPAAAAPVFPPLPPRLAVLRI